MKLQVQGQAVRIRLSEDELATLLTHGRCSDVTSLGTLGCWQRELVLVPSLAGGLVAEGDRLTTPFGTATLATTAAVTPEQSAPRMAATRSAATRRSASERAARAAATAPAMTGNSTARCPPRSQSGWQTMIIGKDVTFTY